MDEQNKNAGHNAEGNDIREPPLDALSFRSGLVSYHYICNNGGDEGTGKVSIKHSVSSNQESRDNAKGNVRTSKEDTGDVPENLHSQSQSITLSTSQKRKSIFSFFSRTNSSQPDEMDSRKGKAEEMGSEQTISNDTTRKRRGSLFDGSFLSKFKIRTRQKSVSSASSQKNDDHGNCCTNDHYRNIASKEECDLRQSDIGKGLLEKDAEQSDADDTADVMKYSSCDTDSNATESTNRYINALHQLLKEDGQCVDSSRSTSHTGSKPAFDCDKFNADSKQSKLETESVLFNQQAKRVPGSINTQNYQLSSGKSQERSLLQWSTESSKRKEEYCAGHLSSECSSDTIQKSGSLILPCPSEDISERSANLTASAQYKQSCQNNTKLSGTNTAGSVILTRERAMSEASIVTLLSRGRENVSSGAKTGTTNFHENNLHPLDICNEYQSDTSNDAKRQSFQMARQISWNSIMPSIKEEVHFSNNGQDTSLNFNFVNQLSLSQGSINELGMNENPSGFLMTDSKDTSKVNPQISPMIFRKFRKKSNAVPVREKDKPEQRKRSGSLPALSFTASEHELLLNSAGEEPAKRLNAIHELHFPQEDLKLAKHRPHIYENSNQIGNPLPKTRRKSSLLDTKVSTFTFWLSFFKGLFCLFFSVHTHMNHIGIPVVFLKSGTIRTWRVNGEWGLMFSK